jgi:hypothetical protein
MITNAHQVMFSYWEMVLFVGITRNKPLLLCLTKVEYMVASQATRQAMWLSSLFGSIGVLQMKPIVIYDDNQSCLSLSKNTIFHVHIKRIEIHH